MTICQSASDACKNDENKQAMGASNGDNNGNRNNKNNSAKTFPHVQQEKRMKYNCNTEKRQW